MTEQKPYHILVVDDNQDLLNYLRMLLAPRYQITCASNGKEALDLLSELMPDLVISDVMMPVMDGMELSRRVKSNFAISHIPFLMLTAKTSNESRKIQPVVTHELSGRLSRQILHFFVHQTFLTPIASMKSLIS